MLLDQYQTSMPLKTLLADFVTSEVLDECVDIQIGGLAIDSRKVKKSDLFFACQGEVSHGLAFADDAVESGAIAVVWADADASDKQVKEVSKKVTCLHCDDLKMKMGKLADRFYQHPSAQLKVTGITGTNGKTSVAHFIAQCLDETDKRCGVLGTLGNGFLAEMSKTGLTTTDALSVHRDLEMLRANDAEYVAMEVSSHGLDQGRVKGVVFDTAVFTNLSHDHLDYHKTLDAYTEAKKKLFFMQGLKAAVINLDDDYGRALAKECKGRMTVWGYSTQSDLEDLHDCTDCFVQASNITAVARGFNVVLKTSKGDGEIFVPLLGEFNVSNLLAVLSVLLINHYSFDAAVKKLTQVSPVSGRMEVLVINHSPTVVVDFAHTPDAIEEACKAIKAHFKGQLICVFGCGGDRDRSKRPLMAKVVQNFADRVIVTNDNPRTENPEKIIDDIVDGFDDKSKVKIILDRAEAIAFAIKNAKQDDVVLLAGKGHEQMQLIAGKSFDFDDRLVAKKCLGAWQ